MINFKTHTTDIENDRTRHLQIKDNIKKFRVLADDPKSDALTKDLYAMLAEIFELVLVRHGVDGVARFAQYAREDFTKQDS